MGLEDDSLLKACRRGDRAAWATLLDRYERLVYSIPLNFGLSRADADDVAQSTFAALIKALDAINDETRIGSWLATVAKRQTWRVAERRRREGPGADEQAIERIASWDGASERMDNVQWVHQAIGRLDDRCRELVSALYLSADESSYATVAEALGLPVGSIGPTRARCLEKLRPILESLRVE